VAQTIEAYVGTTLDDAKVTPTHYKVFALIAAGYFFDILDLIVLGALIPDMVQTKFATATEAGLIGSATLVGLFIGAVGQGQFTDRWGRRTVYQFNLLIFGVFTIAGGLAPSILWLAVFRFIAGVGLGAEQPLTFPYAGEYAP
jgi:MFS transporter, putative metabolite:H+ symporter